MRVYILKTHSYVRELYTGSIPGFTTTRTHVACDTHTRTVSGRRSEHVLQSKAGTHTYFSLSLVLYSSLAFWPGEPRGG